MKIVRIAMSLLVLLVIAISVVGWIWTGTHQPVSQSAASRVVLTLAILAGVIGLTAIWRSTPAERDRSRE